MRIAIGGLLHETSTLSRVPTTLGDFMRTHLEGEEILERRAGTKSALGGYIDAARDFAFEAVPTFWAATAPGGAVTAEALIRDAGHAPLDWAVTPPQVPSAVKGRASRHGEGEPLWQPGLQTHGWGLRMRDAQPWFVRIGSWAVHRFGPHRSFQPRLVPSVAGSWCARHRYIARVCAC